MAMNTKDGFKKFTSRRNDQKVMLTIGDHGGDCTFWCKVNFRGLNQMHHVISTEFSVRKTF